MEPQQHRPVASSLPSAPLHRDADAEAAGPGGRDETLAVLLEQERTGYACGDYLGRRARAGPQHDGIIRPADRTRIVDWCYAVADLCRFDRESVARAMSAVDRYASAPGGERDALLRDRGRYQLLAVTALYVSVKVHERSAVGSEDFSAASRGTYAAEEIEATELEMLRGLGWRMCPPTALQVAFRALDLMEARLRGEGRTDGAGAFEFLREEVAYQTECAVRGYALSVGRPSTVALASVLNAVEQVARDGEEYDRLAGALSGVVGEYDFDSPHVIVEARDRLRSLVDGDDEQGAQAAMVEAEAEEVEVEVFEEDTVDGSRRSLDGVNVVEELEDLREYYRKAYHGAVIVPDDADDDDSCATVHY